LRWTADSNSQEQLSNLSDVHAANQLQCHRNAQANTLLKIIKFWKHISVAQSYAIVLYLFNFLWNFKKFWKLPSKGTHFVRIES
jgi:hypothetical protein